MSQPETLLWIRVRNVLHKKYGHDVHFIKMHGSVFTRSGEPDIIGCYKGRMFAIELKARTGHPVADIQLYRLAVWQRAGAAVGVASSVDECIQIAIHGECLMTRQDWWSS